MRIHQIDTLNHAPIKKPSRRKAVKKTKKKNDPETGTGTSNSQVSRI